MHHHYFICSPMASNARRELCLSWPPSLLDSLLLTHSSSFYISAYSITHNSWIVWSSPTAPLLYLSLLYYPQQLDSLLLTHSSYCISVSTLLPTTAGQSAPHPQLLFYYFYLIITWYCRLVSSSPKTHISIHIHDHYLTLLGRRYKGGQGNLDNVQKKIWGKSNCKIIPIHSNDFNKLNMLYLSKL